MKASYFLLCLLLLCPALTMAQANYKPGFAVTLEGDTLHGYINYREWSNTPTALSFKEEAKSGPVKELDVTNTRYFEITGLDAFQRYTGNISMNPVDHQKLTFDEANLDTVTLVAHVTVFMRVNYQGEFLSLLSYTDDVKTRFFYQERDGSEPQELHYKVFYGLRQGEMIRRTQNGYSGPLLFLITRKPYVGQLQHLARKYDVGTVKVNRAIEAAHYSDYDLEAVFSRMNEMRVSTSGDKARYKVKKTTRYYAGAALNRSTVRMSGMHGLSDPDSNPVSYMPLLSFGFDAFLNRHIQKFYFRAEGTLTAASYHVQDERDFDIDHREQSYRIAHQTISLSPQFIYTLYNKDNFKFHVGALGQLNYSRYTQNQYKLTTTFSPLFASESPTVTTQESDEFRKLMPFWISYGFRAGAVVNKRFELYTTYMPYAAVTQHRTSAIEFGSYYFGLNYLFYK